MKELTECLNTKRKIDEINDKLYELRAAILSPKAQIITGMPRSGSGGDNAIEKYEVKAEALQEKLKRLYDYQEEQWEKVITIATVAGVSAIDMELLYFRFIKGLSWKVCTFEMKKKYKWWNINTTFRKYREALRRMEKVPSMYTKTY